jgi:aquaporin Z
MDFLPLLGEFLGTFLFLISILATGNVLAIGATLTLVIYLLSKVSGGHVNPAVSLAFFLKGTLTNTEFLGYVIVQLLGATAAYFSYKALV